MANAIGGWHEPFGVVPEGARVLPGPRDPEGAAVLPRRGSASWSTATAARSVCQRPDWKNNHKKRCIAKAERAPQPRAPSADCKEAAAEGGITGSVNPLSFKALTTFGERKKMVYKEQCLTNGRWLDPTKIRIHQANIMECCIIEGAIDMYAFVGYPRTFYADELFDLL